MSIRLRLALWYTAVLGVTLVVFSLLLYVLMAQHLEAASDDSIVSRAGHIISTIHVDAATGTSLQKTTLPPIEAFESEGIFVQVVGADGSIVARSSNLGEQQLPVDEQALSALRGRDSLYETSVGLQQARVYVQPVVVDNQVIGFVQVAQSYAEVYATLDNLRLWLVGGGLLSLLLAGGIGWAVAGGALEPIATMTQTARAIALSRGFSRRLEDTGSRDEVGQLGITFNEMLASLEEAYATQQRFVADASHELRTPLTAVQANLELVNRQGDRLTAEERQALLAEAGNETERMANLVSDLLSLARADAGQTLQLRPVELDRLLLEVYRQARLLARDVKLTIREIDQVSLPADADRLRQVLLILIDNATKYTPAGGEVSLSLRQDGAMAVVEVADTGIGISEDDLPHVFERFFRADRARARDKAGTGLGLAIAKWIVEQHGGDIGVVSTLGQGTTFTFRLPLASRQSTGRERPVGVLSNI